MNLVLTKSKYNIIKAAAIEVFPMESFGLLLGEWDGDNAVVQDVFIYQSVCRTQHKVSLQDESQHRILDWFGADSVLGDWHSHPNGLPVLSRIKDFRNRKTQRESDEWDMLYEQHGGDGYVSLISSICPMERKPGWSFRTVCYYTYGRRIRKGKVIYA